MPAPIAVRCDIFEFELDPSVAYNLSDLGNDGRIRSRSNKHKEPVLEQEVEKLSIVIDEPLHVEHGEKLTGEIIELKAEIVIEDSSSSAPIVEASIEEKNVEVALSSLEENRVQSDEEVVVVASSKKLRAKKISTVD